jgi:ABC-type nitrate/sulfonate/bicarbonate transport system substrate-binding protein
MLFRKAACAFAILALCVTFAMAETVKGKITKIGDGKITVTTGKKGETKSMDYEIAKDVKVLKQEGKDKVELQGGLKNEALQNIGKKGVNATLNVDGNRVTEIVIGSGKKKKDAN